MSCIENRETILFPTAIFCVLSCMNYKVSFYHACIFQVISASGAVKHEDVVELVKKLFIKLSTDPTTASQLVAKEPAVFTGSEV